MNAKPFISIVIIGLNTKNELKSLLISIKNLNNKSVEIIYIDDGAGDGSYEMYSSFALQYNKKGKKLNSNMGRTYATHEGILLAKGEWLCFIRSNETFKNNTLDNYLNIIKHTNAKAYAGQVIYSCSDKSFEYYLNSNHRGVQQFSCGEKIHHKYLLFNNSFIHYSVFKSVLLNQTLAGYGGEELDFSYRLNKMYPDQIIACPDATVIRNDYPSLQKHCLRLYEFGHINFKLLPSYLKRDVVRFQCLLNYKIGFIVRGVSAFLFFLYKKNICNYLTIRAIMLCSILRGYYYRGS